MCLSVPYGTGSSDFVDALTVALDSLFRAMDSRPDLLRGAVTKRVVLVSNFLQAVSCGWMGGGRVLKGKSLKNCLELICCTLLAVLLAAS